MGLLDIKLLSEPRLFHDLLTSTRLYNIDKMQENSQKTKVCNEMIQMLHIIEGHIVKVSCKVQDQHQLVRSIS